MIKDLYKWGKLNRRQEGDWLTGSTTNQEPEHRVLKRKKKKMTHDLMRDHCNYLLSTIRILCGDFNKTETSNFLQLTEYNSTLFNGNTWITKYTHFFFYLTGLYASLCQTPDYSSLGVPTIYQAVQLCSLPKSY